MKIEILKSYPCGGGRIQITVRIEGAPTSPDWPVSPESVAFTVFTVQVDELGAIADHLLSYGGMVWPQAYLGLFSVPAPSIYTVGVVLLTEAGKSAVKSALNDFESEQVAYDQFVESMVPHCQCREENKPCDGVLAGGLCDNPNEEPSVDDTVYCCPDCERPNQFGDLCPSCQADRDANHIPGHDDLPVR